MASRLRAKALGSLAEMVVTGAGGAAASMARTRPSTKAIGPAVGRGLRGQHLLELFQPGALLRRVEPHVDQAGDGGQRAHPRAQSEFAQQADEADQIAARAGAAGEIEFAGLRLVVVRGDGELDGLHADVLEPNQFALPEGSRVEVIGKLDGLQIVGAVRRKGGEGKQEQGGEPFQNRLPRRMR